MKNKMKKMVAVSSILVCAGLLWCNNGMLVQAKEVVGTEREDNSRSTNLEWIYAMINGERYMRLWNHTTQEWVTDWVPAVGEPDRP